MTLTAADVPLKRPTVLVADDEVALTDSIAVWLSDSYRVRTAYDGHEALREFGPSVDIVLLDRHMPGLSGEHVMARLNEMSANPQAALLTATSTDDFRSEVDELGFDAYLTKPISKTELLGVVSDLAAAASESAQH
ncbi:response regulator with chey-like receiver domain and winged-helix DNA-binding domain [Halogeometricum borinquense DSM 11551]|uniref:response regulator with CheY-like receiver domain and Winged-helix DNA-binding domain n=2 Tax=Halogeometricum borinquense TaxID=60847 RepID=E4NNA1_HALBP|nr:response regulator [Halogeometricum borinquense]ADQ67439.1 response regulator with CheY-like receiver domain and winged-helix DNA-binding domain [Halogeometricum borinquense DSM 11551]ELY23286.1 response regulator with chey-like receiver domain and winged-helix DNA-binding domain [Halogeometricum borinquense DSM 11551]RYJ14941.1 response regulator transcription factor [Halogeometricum borinquense]